MLEFLKYIFLHPGRNFPQLSHFPTFSCEPYLPQLGSQYEDRLMAAREENLRMPENRQTDDLPEIDKW